MVAKDPIPIFRRSICFIGTLALALCAAMAPAEAPSAVPKAEPQGPVCTGQKIRDAVQKENYAMSDDAFFWSGAYDEPLIGKAAQAEGHKKSEAEAPRKNTVSAQHPQKIMVSGAGDMAYEYGKGELSFDSVKEGKHISFENAYLRVWKSVGGQCEIAGWMIRPIESTVKSQ